jgi:hypothetical protein
MIERNPNYEIPKRRAEPIEIDVMGNPKQGIGG